MSELLYNWRSRAGRSPSPEPELGLDPRSPERHADLRRHPRSHRDPFCRRRNRRVPCRRSLAGPHPTPPHRLLERHLTAHAEHEPAGLGHRGAGESGTGISSIGGSTDNRVDRLRLLINNQLPSVVVQARERLLERLRGISLSARQTTTASDSLNEIVAGDYSWVMDYREREAERPRDWLESDPIFTNLSVETDDLQSCSKKKPPGLSWDVFRNLQLEVFKEGEEAAKVVIASPECSICLERFYARDELIRLSCGHRFHPACLEPWVRSCGDCPYCRTRI